MMKYLIAWLLGWFMIPVLAQDNSVLGPITGTGSTVTYVAPKTTMGSDGTAGCIVILTILPGDFTIPKQADLELPSPSGGKITSTFGCKIVVRTAKP